MIKSKAFRGYSFSKKNGSLFFIGLLFFFHTSCSAQTTPPASFDSSEYELLQTISIESIFFITDKLQQIYVVTPQNELIKYNVDGVELFRFSNQLLGDLTHVDVTNPFNILLYYPEFLTVFTLDRTLNKTGEFNLFDLDFVDVGAVGMSNDNNVWLYEDVLFKLKKINRNGEVLQESLNLSTQFEITPQPNFILERENWLYINDPKIGVMVFDIFAQHLKTLNIKNLSSFQIIDNQLIYREKNELHTFHLQALRTQKIALPPHIEMDHQVLIQRGKLFVNKKDKIEVYQMKAGGK